MRWGVTGKEATRKVDQIKRMKCRLTGLGSGGGGVGMRRGVVL